MMQKPKETKEKPLDYPDCASPALLDIPGDPGSAFEMINKYGTYEIQPTSDADHPYPSIHQGLPRQWKDLRQSKEELFPEYVQ